MYKDEMAVLKFDLLLHLVVMTHVILLSIKNRKPEVSLLQAKEGIPQPPTGNLTK
jgi:hypothetical protein